MKKFQTLSIAAILLFSACSKQNGSSTPNTSTTTTLVTKITDNTTTDPGYNRSVAEFTYNGKQLTQAIIYSYAIPVTIATTYATTTYFNYSAQGQLTGTAIIHSNSNPAYDDVKSVVTYSGNNIGTVTFYKANNVLDRTVTLTYTNGLLTQLSDPSAVIITYTYDSNGNNIKEFDVEYQNGKPDGYQYTVTNSTFDSNSNFQSSLPMWIYFNSYAEDYSITSTPGKNNPLVENDNGTALTYSYVYNSNGYPSTITYPGNYSYKYEYTQVAN